ncbi:unnamed protein product [Allacma fusca]|uniref:Uncharacterized protein n=1 Tax=Allacma fusca TaxID=39272 RepID=A0A8J2LZD0_9HEXA|nr:unnamed protein product [Allacma fusca]
MSWVNLFLEDHFGMQYNFAISPPLYRMKCSYTQGVTCGAYADTVGILLVYLTNLLGRVNFVYLIGQSELKFQCSTLIYMSTISSLSTDAKCLILSTFPFTVDVSLKHASGRKPEARRGQGQTKGCVSRCKAAGATTPHGSSSHVQIVYWRESQSKKKS